MEEEAKDKVYAEVHDQPPARNDNLAGQKSSVSSTDEAQQEQKLSKQQEFAPVSRDPSEVRASDPVLPEDAQKRCELSEEQQ